MSAPHDNEHENDLNPTQTAGYKVAAKKTVDEYAQLDAEDESLARWKASLGIGADGARGASDGPKVVVQSICLTSPTRPEPITLDLTSGKVQEEPFRIKEGAEYRQVVSICFKINNDVVTGLRYLHGVKRKGIRVDKLEKMIGSYGPKDQPYTVNFMTEDAPSGMIARGEYNVLSRVYDDDGLIKEFEWAFKISKEW